MLLMLRLRSRSIGLMPGLEYFKASRYFRSFRLPRNGSDKLISLQTRVGSVNRVLLHES